MVCCRRGIITKIPWQYSADLCQNCDNRGLSWNSHRAMWSWRVIEGLNVTFISMLWDSNSNLIDKIIYCATQCTWKSIISSSHYADFIRILPRMDDVILHERVWYEHNKWSHMMNISCFFFVSAAIIRRPWWLRVIEVARIDWSWHLSQ